MRDNSDTVKTEKFLEFVADSQEFAEVKDELSALVNEYLADEEIELSEDELVYAAAARRPVIPAYKLIDEE